MEGASIVATSVLDRAMASLEAGCDMALICNNLAAAISTIDNLNYTAPGQAHDRIEMLRGVGVMDDTSNEFKDSWQHANNVISEFIV